MAASHRRVAGLCSALLLSSLCAAQIPYNEFMIYPERNGSAATYTSRTSNAKVEQLMEVPAKSFSGVADLGGSCFVYGHYHWATDEDATSQESFHVVFRKSASNGGPDTSNAGIISRSGPFMLPTATGRAGWRITTTVTRPISVPCSGGFFHGLELSADNWPTDGHSIWDARYNPPTSRNVGDNPRANAPRHAWANLAGGTTTWPWTWRMGVLTRAPILNPGGIDPANGRQSPPGSSNYGAGGIYPDVGGNPRRDGLDMRIEDRFNPNAAAVVLIGRGFGTPLALPGIGGRLHMPLGGLVPLGASALSNGVASIPIARPRTLPTTFAGRTFTFQGVTIVNGRLTFTNAAAVIY